MAISAKVETFDHISCVNQTGRNTLFIQFCLYECCVCFYCVSKAFNTI